ncbi:MAG: molybdenum ABC transporter ATP-binding protein [Pseudorhodobacter sp.]|nr:molybdenum ABC transporter ATP-binding protein [Pseudorhodobacter sp.]
MALEVMVKTAGLIPLDLAFRVEPGQLLALVGQSGAGKTTVLRIIAGLRRPEHGRVAVAGTTWLDTATGVSLPPHQRRVGVVFQHYALFPHLTAAQNVASAMGHLPKAERRAEAERLLGLVNLHGLADRRPTQLSGGQQQRVALARALARRPDALLLDEPFSAVDRATRDRLQAAIIGLRAHLAMPVILVTHDMNEAQLLADRLVVIEKGQMVAEGATGAVMSDPVALRALGLREAGATIAARIVAHEADGLTRLETSAGPLLLPRLDAAPGTWVRVRIMAHEVILARAAPQGISALNILPGTVIEVKPGDGPGAFVQVRLGRDTILARVTRRSVEALGLAPGVGCFAILKSMAVARDQVGASADPARPDP